MTRLWEPVQRVWPVLKQTGGLLEAKLISLILRLHYKEFAKRRINLKSKRRNDDDFICSVLDCGSHYDSDVF